MYSLGVSATLCSGRGTLSMRILFLSLQLYFVFFSVKKITMIKNDTTYLGLIFLFLCMLRSSSQVQKKKKKRGKKAIKTGEVIQQMVTDMVDSVCLQPAIQVRDCSLRSLPWATMFFPVLDALDLDGAL